MNYIHVAVAVMWVLVSISVISSDGDEDEELKSESEERVPQKLDIHTFTVLLHIVYTDGSKQQCTGTIIHENVVITVAHCFVKEDLRYAVPELTLSFVVLGTQKMYESGYEQYLPIERVVLHPNFTDWSADLALVYTFTDMTTDRPGHIVPLLGEKTTNLVDSNLTILSWGSIDNDAIVKHPRTKMFRSTICVDSDTENDPKKFTRINPFMDSLDRRQRKPVQDNRQTLKVNTVNKPKQQKPDVKQLFTKHEVKQYTKPNWKQKIMQDRKNDFSLSQERWHEFGNYESLRSRNESKIKNSRKQSNNVFIRQEQNDGNNRESVKRASQDDKVLGDRDELKVKMKLKSLYLKNINIPYLQNRSVENRRTTLKRNKDRPEGSQMQTLHLKSLYRNWRRQMGVVEHKLSVQTFGFVNAQMCKKVVDHEKPNILKTKEGNDIACYTSDDHYVTQADAGAPALSQDRLMAVTVGGLQYDGDNIAVGMRMTCYCQWIADNLPSTGHSLNCCTDCCGIKRASTSTKPTTTSTSTEAIINKKYKFL